MNTIVTWAWKGEREYTLEHIGYLAAMLHEQMLPPYRLVAITDEPGKVPHATVLKTPPAAAALAHLRTVEGTNFPSSFRRLWLFSPEAKELGDVLLLTDLDVMVTGDWSHLFEIMPDEDFVGWKPGQRWGNQETRVGGGTWRLRAGARTDVWTDFVRDPRQAMKDARAAGFRGSDQAWLSFKLAGKVPVFPQSAGICSVRDFTRDDRSKVVPDIPAEARCVHFNGKQKPWHKGGRVQHPWLLRFWPGGPR